MKPHLSISQINMLQRCGLQYDYRYVQGKRVPPGIAMITGTGVHKAVEVNLTTKRDTGVLLPEDAVADAARDAVNAAWDEEEPMIAPEEKETPVTVLRGQSVDTSVSLSLLHHREAAPLIVPVELERRFRIETGEFAYDLMGVIDVQEPDRVIDTKTASKSKTQTDVDTSIQLTAYHLAIEKLTGEPVTEVGFDVLVATKQPKFQPLRSTRSPVDHIRLFNRVARAADVIKAGAFMPAEEGAWVCSPKFCGYWDDCPFGRKGRTRG